MLGLSTSVMILVAALNFWACVVSKDVPGQLQHQQVVDHAQPDKTIANQTAKIVANQNAVIHALHMEIEQLKSSENSTVIQALKAELQAQQRQATAAKIQALETELESQKKLAVMIHALEAKKRDETDEREFRAKVEAQQAQQSAALEDLQQKVADREERPTARQRLKIHKEKGRRGLQGTSACKYDVIEDGRVDVADLLQVLADFHLESCKLRADFNGDCIVNVADLLSLLSAFGGTVSDSDCNMGHSDVAPVAYSHRWLQVTAAGRTVAENSAGPPAPCAANIVGAVYFDTDIAEFLGCTGASWEPLGGSKGNFLCQDGWGGGTCDADSMPPLLTCEAGTVSIEQERNVFPHTLTSADIPRPVIFDTGPGDLGSVRVELSIIDSELLGSDRAPNEKTMVVSSTVPYTVLFDWSAANIESDGLTIDVDIGVTTTFEYRTYDAVGNMASCIVSVIVADIDECDDGSHSCAENALCENLVNSRGSSQGTGTYNCTCPEGSTATPDAYTECTPGHFPGSKLMTETMANQVAAWVAEFGMAAVNGWAICYSSLNGDSKTHARHFHSGCDHKGRTVGIFRIGNAIGGKGKILGFYSSEDWSVSGNTYPTTWLFELTPSSGDCPTCGMRIYPMIEGSYKSAARGGNSGQKSVESNSGQSWPRIGSGCMALGDGQGGQPQLGGRGFCKRDARFCPTANNHGGTHWCGRTDSYGNWGETDLEVWSVSA